MSAPPGQLIGGRFVAEPGGVITRVYFCSILKKKTNVRGGGVCDVTPPADGGRVPDLCSLFCPLSVALEAERHDD